MTSRREFLLSCSKTVTVVTVAPSAFSRERIPGQDRMGLAAFAKQLHTSFSVFGPSGTAIKLKLVGTMQLPSAEAVVGPGQNFRHESFLLCFSGPRDQLLPQSTYNFSHSEMGRFAMFIVPDTHSNPAQPRYEAVFTRPSRNLKGPQDT